MGDDDRIGAAVAQNCRDIGVTLNGELTFMFRTTKRIDVHAWEEILTRHYNASLELPEDEAAGWIDGCLDEVRNRFGGRRKSGVAAYQVVRTVAETGES